jgi:osmotically-inducible protein OsmY
MWKWLLLALVALAGVTHSAAAQVSDQDLVARIAESVVTSPQYGVFDSIDVDVQGGQVRLSGRVTTPAKRVDVATRVQRIEGVRSVKNEIGVLPISPSDDELRFRVARSIYNHPMFWMHGQRPVPPIHIVVEHGLVTLTGLVDSDTQRTMAESLAQVSGSLAVTNRVRVGKQ